MGKINSEAVRGVGTRIKEAREAAGLSREELCRKASLKSENVLRLMEQGVYFPRAKHVAAIARATGTTEQYLLFDRKPDLDIKTPAVVVPTPDNKGNEPEPAKAVTEIDIPDGKDMLYNINYESTRAARKKAGITVEEAARRSGIGSSTIYRCETKKTTATGHTINALARAYGVSAAELVADSTGQKRLIPPEKRGKRSGVRYNKALLRSLREKSGYSRTKVQEKSGIPALTLKDWENDKKHTRVSLERLKKIAALYGVPVESLLVADESTATVEEVNGTFDSNGGNTESAVEKPETASAPKAEAKENAVAQTTDKKPARELPKTKEAVKGIRKLPEDPEKQLCKNILFYIRNNGCSEEEFDKAVGCQPDFFSEAIQHGYRLPLGVSLKAARFFGKTLEEAVYDTTVIELEAELAQIEARLQELDRMLGRKPVTIA